MQMFLNAQGIPQNVEQVLETVKIWLKFGVFESTFAFLNENFEFSLLKSFLAMLFVSTWNSHRTF